MKREELRRAVDNLVDTTVGALYVGSAEDPAVARQARDRAITEFERLLEQVPERADARTLAGSMAAVSNSVAALQRQVEASSLSERQRRDLVLTLNIVRDMLHADIQARRDAAC